VLAEDLVGRLTVEHSCATSTRWASEVGECARVDDMSSPPARLLFSAIVALAVLGGPSPGWTQFGRAFAGPGPRAEQPAYNVGDGSARIGPFLLTRMEGELYVFEAGVGQQLHVTRGLAIAKVVTGGVVRFETNPTAATVWPLEVGRFRTTPASLLSRLPRQIPAFNGGINVVWSVAAYEDVRSGGESLKAFKLVQRIDNTLRGNTVEELGQFILWYAPELRQVVKAQGNLLDVSFDFVPEPVQPIVAGSRAQSSGDTSTEATSRRQRPDATPSKPGTSSAPATDTEAPKIALNHPAEGARFDQEQILVVGLVTDNVAVEQVLVSVNGQLITATAEPMAGARSRSIRHMVTLQPGGNVIEVTAIDKAGNASQLVRTVTRSIPAGAVPDVPSRPQPDRWAVVVGIGGYDNPSIPKLKYAVSDADAIARTLAASAGFKKENILLLTDRTELKPTLKNIKYALGTFLARSAKKDDTVLIFFAGHGAPEADPRGLERDGLAKYLIPSDADPDDLFSTALPMDDMQAIFGRIEAERVVAFLDACYSGAAGGRTFMTKKTRGGAVDDLFLERLTRSKGRAIVTAARPSEVSIELPELGHGLFTYYLIEGLKGGADLNRDGIVTLQELYEYLEQQVTKKSRSVGATQHPVMKGELEGVLPLTKVRAQ
jgi:hypothetical protein